MKYRALVHVLFLITMSSVFSNVIGEGRRERERAGILCVAVLKLPPLPPHIPPPPPKKKSPMQLKLK